MFKNISVSMMDLNSNKRIYINILKLFWSCEQCCIFAFNHMLPVATCAVCFRYMEEEECVLVHGGAIRVKL